MQKTTFVHQNFKCVNFWLMISALNHFVKDTIMNVIISSMMNLMVFATIIGLTQAFPTEKILDIDKTPCHAEALEVCTTICILNFRAKKIYIIIV